MLQFIFVMVCGLFLLEANLCTLSCICIAVRDPSMDLSRGDPINQFNIATFLCMPQAKT